MKRTFSLTLVFVTSSLILILCPALSLGQSVNVLTWHNDNWRTGQNTNETTLTASLVGDDTKFGKKCSYSLPAEAWVFAQPLVVSKVKINGITYNEVVYVVTMQDTVHAFDGVNVNSNGSCIPLLGPVSLLMSGEQAVNVSEVGGKNSFGKKIGILGTPVIQITGTSPTTTGTLYAVAESEPTSGGPPYYHRLWALDIMTLSTASGSSVQICKDGCATQSSSDFSRNHLQRPGLLWLCANGPTCPTGLQNNTVYVAVSMIDGNSNNPDGWIWGYNAQNLAATPLSYETTDFASGKRRGRGSFTGGLMRTLPGMFIRHS